MVGYKPQDGDDVAIIEDVVTGRHRRAGVHRALQARGRREHECPLCPAWTGWSGGTRECSTLDEPAAGLGIQVFPIVTVREVIAFLHNNPIDGKFYIDDGMKAKNGSLSGAVRGQRIRKGQLKNKGLLVSRYHSSCPDTKK